MNIFNLFKRKNKVVDVTPKSYAPVSVTRTVDDDFLTSAAIGYAVDDGIIGGLLGGSICGGIVGDMLNDSDSSSYDISSCESGGCDDSCDFGD